MKKTELLKEGWFVVGRQVDGAGVEQRCGGAIGGESWRVRSCRRMNLSIENMKEQMLTARNGGWGIGY